MCVSVSVSVCECECECEHACTCVCIHSVVCSLVRELAYTARVFHSDEARGFGLVRSEFSFE